MANATTYTAETWPIAACMHGFDPIGADGTPMHDAPASTWAAVFAEVQSLGFNALEISDGHIRIAELSDSRRSELVSIADDHGITLTSLHVARQSVIMPGHEAKNLEYAHRSIEACAAMGIPMFSTGLHQPFTQAQKDALWFWTAQGPIDPDDAAVRKTAVDRIRELGNHAADLGLQMSLEMYEDTYLGTADSAVQFIEEVGLSNVGLNPDIGNLVRLHRPIEDWQEMYAKTLPYANYWHLKNYARDEAGDGSWFTAVPSTLELGLINYRKVIRDALALGYSGVFLMEQYGGDSLGVCATNARYVRSLLPRA
ncbi:sugar phosphate isomerase/epimerase family protein [Humidisolicoccus flavus]|uniref:sugar phosphate isomerase/epimerase family protein n=1 Tax=Humidisolicoccus flavus TaxID=3111414 RepID=UPI00324FE25D